MICRDFPASLVMRAVPSSMDRCHCSAGFISSGLEFGPLLLLSLVLLLFSFLCGHGTTQRFSPDARGMCLDFAASTSMSQISLFFINYPASGILLQGRKWTKAESKPCKRIYFLGPDIASARFPPITCYPFTVSSHSSWLCLQMQVVPFPSSLGAAASSVRTPRNASVRAPYKVTLQFGSASQSSLPLPLF